VVDDVEELLLEQARVDGVVDRADAGDAVPGLQVPPGIPGERPDPIAEPDSVLREPLRQLEGAAAHVGVGGPVDRSVLDPARRHGAAPVLGGGMVDDAMDEQGPILHQTKHGVLRRLSFLLGLTIKRPAPRANRRGAGRRRPRCRDSSCREGTGERILLG